jgi:hypothetical protein
MPADYRYTRTSMRAAPLSPMAIVKGPTLAFAAVSMASLASMGCTGTVAGASGGPSLGGDADSAVTQAVVLVERTLDTSEGAESVRATASARFARVAAGVTAVDTLRAIGASLDLPARGSCAGIGADDTTAATTDAIPVVDLLDMGHVSVEAEGAVTALVPRQLPYVTDVVTGTVYARAAEATVLPAGALYVVHVAGVAGVAGFDVAATAPRDPSDVTITQETTPGRIAASGAAVDFAWPSGAAGDVIYVEVQPAGVRCTLGDGATSAGDTEREMEPSGSVSHASVASSLLDTAGSIVVHRVHSQRLQPVQSLQSGGGGGIDGGELRFDFSRVVAYTRP